jgi:hypothetical protein
MKVLTVVLLWAGLAGAQATRTWVSGVGDDVNPCSRTAPCKTFAGAISKTAAGGEIDALDPGGFGNLTINKSITIDGGGGQVASVLAASGTNGFLVTAGASDTVILRNLRINGIKDSTTPGLNGIRWISGKALVIENCDIFGFSNNGIDIATAGGKALILNTVSSNNGAAGISVESTNTTFVDIRNSTFAFNTNGVLAGNFSIVTATGGDASSNTQAGFVASATVGTAVLTIVDSTSASNNVAVQAGGGPSPATTNVSNVAMAGNNLGFNIGLAGTIKSFGNNTNLNGGSPTPPNLVLQ